MAANATARAPLSRRPGPGHRYRWSARSTPAGVAELADAPGLGPGPERDGSSSLPARTGGLSWGFAVVLTSSTHPLDPIANGLLTGSWGHSRRPGAVLDELCPRAQAIDPHHWLPSSFSSLPAPQAPRRGALRRQLGCRRVFAAGCSPSA